MTRTTNSRVAGFAFLAYIVVGIVSMILHGKAVKGDDIVAQLASINQHQSGALKETIRQSAHDNYVGPWFSSFLKRRGL